MKKKFETTIAKLEDSRVYMYHIVVPAQIVDFYKAQKQKRLLCKVNDLEAFSTAILTLKDGYGYINFNKERLKKGGLMVGSKVTAFLEPDNSKYGMPLPQELEEIFRQDAMAKDSFKKLSPGVQRTLLYTIGKVKSIDKRIEKAIRMTNYLKQLIGKFDFKEFNDAMKKDA